MDQDNSSLPPGANGGPAAPQDEGGISIRVLAQYVKDISFENPTAPKSLLPPPEGTPQPTIEVSVDVAARRLADVDFESELTLRAKSMRGGDVLFMVELVYAGVFRIEGAPPEMLEPLLLIEGPRQIFPFARRIVADATRDGGFLPLLIDPVDFAGLYRQQRERQQAKPAEPTASA